MCEKCIRIVKKIRTFLKKYQNIKYTTCSLFLYVMMKVCVQVIFFFYFQLYNECIDQFLDFQLKILKIWLKFESPLSNEDNKLFLNSFFKDKNEKKFYNQ